MVDHMFVKSSSFSNFPFLQSIQKGAKKTAMGDEWRNASVEERLEYSLVKVIHQHRTLSV